MIEKLTGEDENEDYENSFFDEENTLKNNSSAKRGTAYHKVFQNIEFQNKNFDEQLELILNEKLTDSERQLVDKNVILKVLALPFFNQIKTEDKVIKEREFYAKINAKQIFEGADNSDNFILQGVIDLLVLNAGIRKFGKISELSFEDFSYSIDVNLKGPFYVVSLLLKNVKKAKGTVIFIGSHAGRYPFGLGAAYCSSKRGLEALSECLMEEVRREGVKVIHLSLGAIKNRDHGYEEEWKIKPEELGNTILKLLEIPRNLLPSDINLRPQSPKELNIEGIELMQYK